MQLNDVKQHTSTLVDGFINVCNQYKEDSSFGSNEHDELADDLIKLLTKFKLHLNNPDEKIDKKEIELMDFFVLVALINDINCRLQELESIKFRGKLQCFIRKFNVSFLTYNVEMYGRFGWKHQDTHSSHGFNWAKNNGEKRRHENSFSRLYEAIKQSIQKYVDQLNVSYDSKKVDIFDFKTMSNYYNGKEGLLDRWSDTLSPLDTFIREHKSLFAEATEGCLGFLRRSKFKTGYHKDLNLYIKHAQESNNRSRQAFVNLGWMDREGKVTDVGKEAMPDYTEKQNTNAI